MAATGEFEQIFLHSNGLRSLSELPMTKLIQIKLSLTEDVDNVTLVEDLEGRAALALPMVSSSRGINNKSIRRHGDWEEKGKDSKISQIFQLAITTLSFLAFGGYLLTLIITTIQRNTTAANGTNFIVLSNLQNLSKYQRPKRNTVIIDTMLNDSAIDQFYQGMIMLSEGYVTYTKLK
ncbi:uncharacterized protein LOC114841085 [Diachasma alloeum]|uniref:uncharacterized protein LOC114841085 n=1 Tax=Diachasma alloeum TaxID=454923 RepID=UPI0010FB7AA9|nr:uncharacterized protein LOC114841085 [Diachasma alloeum]